MLASTVIDYASYREMQRRFDVARRWMLAFAVVGATAIAVFAWAANPPDDVADALVAPPPVQVRIALTGHGREALAGALGPTCVTRPVAALMIGGTREAPLVVALPRTGCTPSEFTLAPALGTLLGGAPAAD